MKRWIALFCAACTSPSDSANTPSSSSYADDRLSVLLDVESNGLQALVRAEPNVSGTRVVVSGGDVLFAEATDSARTSLVAFGSEPSGYAALLSTRANVVTVGLERAAATSRVDVVLPPAFTITLPSSPASRSQPIKFTWDPSTVDMATIAFSGCGNFERSLGSDVGSFTLQPADLPQTNPCTLQIMVSRTRTIVATSSFPRAAITTTQRRTTTLETVP
jgi:hypothetical protein